MSSFPVRDEIADGRKPAKLIPEFAKREGAEAATIRRFKGLRDLILAAIPFVITDAVPPRNEADVLLPPFDATWIEWAERHYKVGAHVRWSSAGTLCTTVVIAGPNRSSFYDLADAVNLDDCGRFVGRADFAAKSWPSKPPHERSAYERAYDILAYLNRVGAMVEEIGAGEYLVRAAGEPSDEITTVVVNVADSSTPSGATRRDGSVRPLHEVRGHLRRYRSGKVSWVQPHTRGDARNGTHIATYRVDPAPRR